jgi:hypothetical protein
MVRSWNTFIQDFEFMVFLSAETSSRESTGSTCSQESTNGGLELRILSFQEGKFPFIPYVGEAREESEGEAAAK